MTAWFRRISEWATARPAITFIAVVTVVGLVGAGLGLSSVDDEPEEHRELYRLTQIEVGKTPQSVAVGSRYVWVTLAQDRAVQRIDPETNEIVEPFNPVGEIP